jgi:hypothetical protein
VSPSFQKLLTPPIIETKVNNPIEPSNSGIKNKTLNPDAQEFIFNPLQSTGTMKRLKPNAQQYNGNSSANNGTFPTAQMHHSLNSGLYSGIKPQNDTVIGNRRISNQPQPINTKDSETDANQQFSI